MTTVAYKKGILAADSLVTCNGLRDGWITKIHRIGPVLIGAAGPSAICNRFRDWVKNGMTGEAPFVGEEGNGLLVSREAIICFSTSGCWRVNADFYALGSGYTIAMGAMEVGASAEEAVHAAIKWDTASGGPVTVLSL